jgi:hypothetical protein
MGDVVELHVATKLDLPPDNVLQGAVGKVADVVVVGWDNDGDLYIAASQAALGEILILLEKAKEEVLRQVSSC